MNRISSGWVSGFIGVLIFSGSLPATRLAIISFDPVFLTAARACIAGFLGIILLSLFQPARPNRNDLKSLAVVALGVVVGFPLLSALALQHITSAHSCIFAGLLPLATALFGILREKTRPRPLFWAFSLTGSASVGAFAINQGIGQSSAGDALMLAAVLICGMGYAEGAHLTRKLGGWQVISWALALALPIMLFLLFVRMPSSFENVEASAWWGLVYVSIFSMLLGFVFWYHGLAKGGIAAVSQLQLMQPFFALLLAAALLHETVSRTMLLAAMATILCVAGAKRFA